MADLSKIISENVDKALARAKVKAKAEGERHGWSELARRMSRHLPAPKDPTEKRDPETIERRIRDFRAGVSEWRADYVEAAAAVLGTHPARLVSEQYDEAKVPEATVATFLTNALGRRLEPGQARRIVAHLHRELDTPGMFELCDRVVRAVLDAKGPAEATGAMVLAVHEASHLWEKQEETDGGSKPRRHRR